MKYIYAALAGIAFTTPSFAQNITAEAGLSTLGLYAAPVYEMNENIDIRVPLYFGSQNYKSTEVGTTIDGKVTSESVGVMLDYYPSGSGFRISGGLTAGGYNFDASTASLEFDGTTYTSDFDLNIKQDKNIVPVIALGYTRPVGQSGWQILAEAGARFTHLTATVSGQNALAAADKDAFESDFDEFNNELSINKFIPFITIGASFSF
jgi:hypothetical protein